jgi:hypothetical protein
VKVIAFFCTKFSIIPCANLPSAHPIIYTFHTICKKRKYIILHSHHQGENTIPPTHFYFSLGKQKFLHGHAEKNHGQTAKNKSAIKPHSNKVKKIILQGKKLPSHSKIVHTNRTLKDSIKKEQIFHYLYGFI